MSFKLLVKEEDEWYDHEVFTSGLDLVNRLIKLGGLARGLFVEVIVPKMMVLVKVHYNASDGTLCFQHYSGSAGNMFEPGKTRELIQAICKN